MKRLFLLRHAKAEAPGRVDDFDRGLTEKGEGDAARLGLHLERIGFMPDLARVSAARRTQQTFNILAGRITRPIGLALEQTLYNASASQIRDVVVAAEPQSRALMIVGHNPGIMSAAIDLAGDGDWTELDTLRRKFPPCALAVLTFRAESWQEIRPGDGWLEFFLTPDSMASER